MTKAAKKQEIGAAASGRTLLLTTTDGEARITIPVGSRVTFGPTIPSKAWADQFHQLEAK